MMPAEDPVMQVSTVLHHLVAVSTELQLGRVFTSSRMIRIGNEALADPLDSGK